jgi:hypothetical protein
MRVGGFKGDTRVDESNKLLAASGLAAYSLNC